VIAAFGQYYLRFCRSFVKIVVAHVKLPPELYFILTQLQNSDIFGLRGPDWRIDNEQLTIDNCGCGLCPRWFFNRAAPIVWQLSAIG
jgi:hypothetical protein